MNSSQELKDTSLELTKKELSDQDKPQYKILKKLGHGKSATVYKCEQKSSQDLFALKKYTNPKEHKSDFENEIDILEAMDHKNLLKMVNKQPQNSYLILEYMMNGELFDYVAQAGKQFPRDLCRYYFGQLLDAVSYMHRKNYCHRDIKLENCLLDENFEVKLSDFGFSCRNEQGSSDMDRILGTEGYMAPELCRSERYNGFETDVFSLGVVLFVMNQGFPPFYRKPVPNDPYYRFFESGKQDKYWYNLRNKFHLTIEDDFIDLINRMIEPNAENRITIEEIYRHPYMQGEVMSESDRIKYMQGLKYQMENSQN